MGLRLGFRVYHRRQHVRRRRHQHGREEERHHASSSGAGRREVHGDGGAARDVFQEGYVGGRGGEVPGDVGLRVEG